MTNSKLRVSHLFLLVLLCGFSFNAFSQTNPTAAPVAESKADPVSLKKDLKSEKDHDLKEVLNQFLAFSRIYRKSGEEATVRNLLVKIAERQNLVHSVDASGNLTVVIPGTGKFEHETTSIGIQGHMDMVLDVKDLKASDNAENYFHKPIDLVVENGIVESKGRMTSIGADDGAGIAIMTRYMRHPELEHPPIKLFFTTEEETGMSGAQHLDLPTDLRAFINVDDELFGEVATGCLGFHMVRDDYQAKSATLPSETSWKTLQITLSGLLGGHSGDDIHRGRGNASKIMAEILKRVTDANKTSGTDAYVVSLIAGEYTADKGVFNKIPKSAELNLALPASQVDSITKLVTAYRDELNKNRQDEKETVVLTVTQAGTQATSGVALNSITRLVSTVSSLENGIITKNPDFTNGMDLSSNFSFFGIQKNASDADYSITVGMMPRSFTDPGRETFVSKVESELNHVDLPGKFVRKISAPAWTPDPNSKLVAVFKNRFEQKFPKDKIEIISVAGGLETAHFSAHRPNLPMISIGPTIENEHSYNETLDIQSVSKLMGLLDDLLIDIGNNREIMK